MLFCAVNISIVHLSTMADTHVTCRNVPYMTL